MPNYRRAYIPGSTIFLTWVTHRRAPLFKDSDNVTRFRQAVRQTKAEAPFEIVAAAILPDHIHFIWTLPDDDSNYSKRVGRIKVLFTRALRGKGAQSFEISESRWKHRESDVWQRRFWEHTIRAEEELAHYLDYVHYNPVKHGWVSCPHQWPHSSFQKWINEGHYQRDWGCQCSEKKIEIGEFLEAERYSGE
ncbi:MAG: transposase [Cyanobacteria bacterium P01_D01_bin.156]